MAALLPLPEPQNQFWKMWLKIIIPFFVRTIEMKYIFLPKWHSFFYWFCCADIWDDYNIERWRSTNLKVYSRPLEDHNSTALNGYFPCGLLFFYDLVSLSMSLISKTFYLHTPRGYRAPQSKPNLWVFTMRWRFEEPNQDRQSPRGLITNAARFSPSQTSNHHFKDKSYSKYNKILVSSSVSFISAWRAKR